MTDVHFEFEVDGKTIPAALTEPVGGNSQWCVLLVPGSGPSDIDGNFPEGGMWPGRTNVLRDLAEQIADRGIACVRYSRANMKTTDEAKAQAFKAFDHRAKVVAELCAVARERTRAPHIAVAGHSEGSVVGSMLCVSQSETGGADRRSVDGIMQIGPMKMSQALYRKAIEVARYGTPPPEELHNLPFGFHKMDPDTQDYLRGYDRVDNREMMAQVQCPVLIIQGGADESVWSENGELLVEVRCERGLPTEYAFFTDLDHFYKRPAAESVDPRVATAIVDWLNICRS